MTTPSYLHRTAWSCRHVHSMRPDAGDFLEFSELSDALVLETLGQPGPCHTAARHGSESWRDDAYKQLAALLRPRRTAAWSRGPGSGCELQENLGSALLHVDVLNEFTGRGHRPGAAGARRGAGRRRRPQQSCMTFTEHPADFDADGPDVIRPATGTGGAAGGGPRRPLRRGGRLPPGAGGAVQRPGHAAGRRPCWTPWNGKRWPGPGTVRARTWTDRCPDEYVEQLAVLMSRMSTDAPPGALSYEPEAWDAARVRHVEDTWMPGRTSPSSPPHGTATAANWPRTPCCRLAAGKPWLADQDDTLVAAKPPRAPPGHAGQDPQPPPPAGGATRRWNASSRSTPRKTTTCSPSTLRLASGPPGTTANGSDGWSTA